jgi:hypothetical protein
MSLNPMYISTKCIGLISLDWVLAIVRILGEFYQLLFHLSSLGVHAVESAYQEYKNTWWKWYSKTQAGAADVLSMLIPILNLYLLLTAPITLPGNIPAQYLPNHYLVFSSDY